MRRLRGVGIVISVMLVLEMLASASTLPDLRSLETPRDPSQDSDLNLNKTLVDSKLFGTTIKPLTEALPTEVNKAVEIKPASNLTKEIILSVKLTIFDRHILINEWKERKIAPLQPCNSLITFQISNGKMEELPDRWVAACTLLEELTVWRAKNLTKVPANLLGGATALQSLEFSDGVLESLPDGFLLGATNLTRLILYGNRLTILTSASLVGPALKILSLHGNLLRNEAMEIIASLTTLETLDIKDNPLSNLCERNSYSMFKNLTELRRLYVTGLNITHLCRDWSEMKFLEKLDFSKTQITELEFNDVYQSRDPSVYRVTYVFDSVKLDKIRLTQDEYELAVRSPSKPELVFVSDSLFKWGGCDVFESLMHRPANLTWIPFIPCTALVIVEN